MGGIGDGGQPESAGDSGGEMFAGDSFSPSSPSSDSPSMSQSSSADTGSAGSRGGDTPMKAEAPREQARSDDTRRTQVQQDITRNDVQQRAIRAQTERAQTMGAAPRPPTNPAMEARQRDEFVPAQAPSRAQPALRPSAPPEPRGERAATMGASRRSEETKAEAPAPSPSSAQPSTRPSTPAQPESRGERAATMGASRRPEETVKAENPAPVPLRSMQGFQPSVPARPTSTQPASRGERAVGMAAPRRPEDASKTETPAKAKTPPSPPRQGGYRPGALWVDPVFNKDQIRGGVIDNAKFPDNKAPVTKPPAAMDAALGRRPIEYTDASGATRKASTPDEYRSQISANRRAAGVPELGGEPVGVHMAIQGGGGAGRRYPSALNEMAAQGIVPTSASGSSAGAITAAFIAAGATPQQLTGIVQDKALADMMDKTWVTGRGGLADGQKAYDFFDKKLQEVTGIEGRPVTFRDLPMPLQIIGTKGNDSQKGVPDMSIPSNRAFVFSQETTPDTPVALAMRASMAIPGVFDPVKAVDPSTGRKIDFIDGGVVDNLPVGTNKGGTPTVGLAPIYQQYSHPEDNKPNMKRSYAGDMVGNYSIPNYWRGTTLNEDAAARGRDFQDKTQPRAGQFMLGVPTSSASDPKVEDYWLDFGWDKKVDPMLDKETRGITQQFFKGALPNMGNPNARATNVDASLPKEFHFNRQVTFDNRTYDASYSSSYLKGDSVFLHPRGKGPTEELNLGRKKVESMFIDDRNFGGNRIGSYLMDELRTRKEKAEALERGVMSLQ